MTKRAICPDCNYILARCLCSSLEKIYNQTKIIILQHPSETDHALNTARLMLNSFQNIALFIGEDFSDHQELNTIIENNQNSIALIFPSEKDTILTTEDKSITHLLLIDGTWKKARKIFMLSKNLHSLKAFSLMPTKKGQYTIRSSNFENGLSTVEATIHSLKIIEAELETNSLEVTFLKMIDFQIEKMGKVVFNKNYKKKSDE